ncbi:MAG TPA: tRNA (N6-threonylcarbamoyladenosine(37)-N6)-methyltransferase TrmO [Candidatus Thermoplasmatota archaeon]|nr:tRNA (N6-threonylcarbamoyladenosine(37)-N6)-methyltransferase TrmO [Candidatus Thermoplasmatota archaeon]
MQEIPLRVIGVVRSPFPTPLEAPRQGEFTDKESRLEIHPEYAAALDGLERHARILVVYWAHGADRSRLASAMGEGVFAGRSPHRPNPILITEVALGAREGMTLRVTGLDAVDGSPLLDLKPALAEWEGPGGFIGNWDASLRF